MVDIVSEIVKEEKDKWSYEEGVIKIVLPLNNRVEVAVEPIFHPNDDYDSHLPAPSLYNSQFSPRGPKNIPMLQCFIPLINFDASSGQELNTLVGKHVRVKVWDRLYASEAELLSFSKYERSYKSGIATEDMFLAEKHGIEAPVYLKTLGYSNEEIEEYLSLSLEEVLPEGTDTGVIRLEGAAYWDKDIPRLSERDIKPKKWTSLLEENAKALKDKLCHMPIIMFTGK